MKLLKLPRIDMAVLLRSGHLTAFFLSRAARKKLVNRLIYTTFVIPQRLHPRVLKFQLCK